MTDPQMRTRPLSSSYYARLSTKLAASQKAPAINIAGAFTLATRSDKI